MSDPSLRAVIAGSRSITDPAMLDAALIAWGWRAHITTVLCGMAPGADLLGKAWAEARGIPVEPYPADWDDLTHPDARIVQGRHGPYDANAGKRRNVLMSERAAAALILWDGTSTGSAHMARVARRAGLRVYVYTLADYARYRRAVGWTSGPVQKRPRYEVL